MKNKVSQEARRQIRRYVTSQYTILNEVIKPRPKYVPLWLWAWSAKIFIDTARLRDFMENGIAGKNNR